MAATPMPEWLAEALELRRHLQRELARGAEREHLHAARGLDRRSMSGIAKAAVLPLPVRLCTSTSRPSMMCGNTACCTGVGWV
jgi:hypothetical protein